MEKRREKNMIIAIVGSVFILIICVALFIFSNGKSKEVTRERKQEEATPVASEDIMSEPIIEPYLVDEQE